MLNIKSITLRPRRGSSSKTNAPDYYHRARIYVGPADETVVENFLVGRHTRPHTVYRKEVLPQLFNMLGIKNVKVGWSQKAGCTSCPCSPGFIVSEGDVGYDIHVTVVDTYVRDIQLSGTLFRGVPICGKVR